VKNQEFRGEPGKAPVTSQAFLGTVCLAVLKERKPEKTVVVRN